MSRYIDWDGDDAIMSYDLWEASARRALKGKRGRKALADLREALLALPEHRLISGALCTRRTPEAAAALGRYELDVLNEHLQRDGSGVCGVGAYVWWQKVKAGMDPDAAFDSLPLLDDYGYDIEATAMAGQRAGLTYTLAWELAYRNDETYEGLTAEERWVKLMAWLDAELGISEGSAAGA